MYPKFIPYMGAGMRKNHRANAMPNMMPNMMPGMMPNNMPPKNMPHMFPKLQLARAYIVPQPYIGLLPINEALKQGSIFPNLIMPYKNKKK